MTDSRVLIVGVGSGGSRLTDSAYGKLDTDCLVISADTADALSLHPHIRIQCDNMINPSVSAIRAASHEPIDTLQKVVAEYDTIIILSNLAGRTGAAISPTITQACHKMQKRVISFCVMPFRFEKDRLFNAGVSLRQVQVNSDSLVILDNDSLLECNPNLTIDECYRIGNDALIGVLGSFDRSRLSRQGVIATGPHHNNADESLRDAIKMLYATAPPNSIKRSIMYVAGDIPVGSIESVSRLTSGITDASVEVVAGQSHSGIVLVSSLESLGKFETYDPLGAIPIKLDDEYPDGTGMNISACLDLYNLE